MQETSALRPLTTSELIRETQAIALSVPAAQAADEQGACLRAVENQRNGDSALSLRAMINWCRANPRVRAEFMRLMGCSEGETDPDFHQALHLLIQAQIRREAAAAEDLAPGAPPAADLFGGTR